MTVTVDSDSKSTDAKDSFLALAAALPLQSTLTSLVILPVDDTVPIAYLTLGELSSILILPPLSNLNRIEYSQDGLSQLRVTKSGMAFLALCQERGIAVYGKEELLSLREI